MKYKVFHVDRDDKRKIRVVHNAMMRRCYNYKDRSYKYYGEKGVTVCDEWHHFQVFLEWAIENGWKSYLQLDKDIKYKEKHGTNMGMIYSPEYCCFVTTLENANSKTNTRYVEYNGVRMSLADACRAANKDPNFIRGRMQKGMSFEDAISIPWGLSLSPLYLSMQKKDSSIVNCKKIKQ